MPQFAKPISDVSSTSSATPGTDFQKWPTAGATTHAEAIASRPVSPTSFADRHIRRAYLGTGPEWAESIMKLSPLLPPVPGPHILRTMHVCPIDGDCQILNGDDLSLVGGFGTLPLVASYGTTWQFQAGPVDATDSAFQESWVANIHDYGNLYLRLYQADDGGVSSDTAAITWAEFEVPNALPVVTRTSLQIGAWNAPATTWTDVVTIPDGQDILVVSTHNENGGSDYITSITLNGVALVEQDKQFATTWSQVQVWYMVDPPKGTFPLVTTLNTSSRGRHIAQTFVNVNKANPFRTTQKTFSDSAALSTLTVPGVVSGDYVLDFLTIDAPTHAPVVGTDQAKVFDTGSAPDNSNDIIGSEQLGYNGGVMSWTWTTAAPYSHIATALRYKPNVIVPPTYAKFPKFLPVRAR